MNLYSVFMPDIAAELVSRGFKLIKTKPNLKKPQFLVYQFENTIEFQLALKEILKERR